MAGRLRIPAALMAAPARDRRREKRTRVRSCNEAAGVDFVVVTEISPGGARLITPLPMEIGGDFRLKLPLLEPLHGTIVWVSNRLAGCEFLEPLHPAQLRVLLAAVTVDEPGWKLSLEGGPFSPA